MTKLIPSLALTAAALCAAPAAQAQSRHDRRHGGHHGPDVQVHVCTSHTVPGHYETQQQRVYNPGGWVVETREVPVPGRWEVTYEEVSVPGRWEVRQKQVHVPARWVVDSSCRCHHRSGVNLDFGDVRVRFGGATRACSHRRYEPARLETRNERVWIPPTCERKPVRKFVPACTRSEQVRVYKQPCWETKEVKVWMPARTVSCCETQARPYVPQAQPSRRHHRRRGGFGVRFDW